MRGAVLMCAFVVPAVLPIAGAAYARTIDRNGGDCKGTDNAHTVNGSPKDDRMLVLEGAYTPYGVGGMDALKGKGGGDRISVARATTRSRAATVRAGSTAARATTSSAAGPTASPTTTPS